MRGFQNSNFGSKKSCWHSDVDKFKEYEDTELNFADIKIHITVNGKKSGILCDKRNSVVLGTPNFVPGQTFIEMRQDHVPRGYFCKNCLREGEDEDWNDLSPKLQLFLLSVEEI